jgi:hypothetical protein
MVELLNLFEEEKVDSMVAIPMKFWLQENEIRRWFHRIMFLRVMG